MVCCTISRTRSSTHPISTADWVYVRCQRPDVCAVIWSRDDSVWKCSIRKRLRRSATSVYGFRVAGLLGRDIATRLGEALDPLLDVAERLEAGFDRVDRDISQHVGCDGVAQTVEIIDELTAACGEK